MSPRLLVVNGPNLNLLGLRRPDVYGSTTLDELDALCRRWGAELGYEVETFQSNHEGALIDRLHAARGEVDAVVINPGALTHYSYALHDAIEAIEIPTVEVHISNVAEREPWRRRSVTAAACVHRIYGRGIEGYRWAIRHLHHRALWTSETVAYGPEADQVGDRRRPVNEALAGVVLLHGGFWRHQWTRDTLDGIAVDLARRGFATWNIEYRRIGPGGGWPAPLLDVAAAVDTARDVLGTDRIVVLGHSAGGQLALWAAARRRLPADAPGAAPAVMPDLAVGLAPVADLERAEREHVGGDAVGALLRGTPDHRAKYAIASPRHLLPLGVPQLIAHGDADDVVPVDHGRAYAAAAAEAGDDVELIEVEGADHFALIDPLSDAWARVAARLEDRATG